MTRLVSLPTKTTYCLDPSQSHRTMDTQISNPEYLPVTSLSTPRAASSGASLRSSTSAKSSLKQRLKKKPSLSQLIDRARSVSTPVRPSPSSNTTPTSVRSNLFRGFSQEHIQSPLTINLERSDEDQLVEVPPWDRTVDIVFHQYPRHIGGPDKAIEFRKSTNLFLREHKRLPVKTRHDYFSLPAEVRFLIWQYVIGHDPAKKPVLLTATKWAKGVWRRNEFTSLFDSSASLQPYFEVNFEFRSDALISFLMVRRFHVIYNPYIGPRLSPLSTKWLQKYGPYIQNLTVEIDMTRHGFGAGVSDHLMRPGTGNLNELLKDFAHIQEKRRGISTMSSFILLCRRYYGVRPRGQFSEEMIIPSGMMTSPHLPSKTKPNRSLDSVEYCPDGYLTICNPLKSLHGLVDSARICGFSQAYTVFLLRSLFPQPLSHPIRFHTYQVAPSTLWPCLHRQNACFDRGDGYLQREEFSSISSDDNLGPYGATQLSAPVVSEDGRTWIPEEHERTRRTPRDLSTLSVESMNFPSSSEHTVIGQ